MYCQRDLSCNKLKRNENIHYIHCHSLLKNNHFHPFVTSLQHSIYISYGTYKENLPNNWGFYNLADISSNSHDLNAWFRSENIRRNYTCITFRGQRVKKRPQLQWVCRHDNPHGRLGGHMKIFVNYQLEASDLQTF